MPLAAAPVKPGRAAEREHARYEQAIRGHALVALACTPPPLGRRRWTLRLLADKLVEPRYIDGVSHEAVRQVRRKNQLKPWLTKRWCIPPEEIHHTPKHGSWLNTTELELSVLARQCLDRRIPDRQTLGREVAAWEAERNSLGGKVDWRFTTADARIKLKRLYPSIEV